MVFCALTCTSSKGFMVALVTWMAVLASALFVGTALGAASTDPKDPVPFREYQSFDGWYHNLAEPEWGAADRPLYRRSIPEYYDGAGEPSGWDRPNPRDISEAVMSGKSGYASLRNRTALLTYFGQQVVEEMLDAQRQGCIPEYVNIPINDTDPLYGGIYYKYIPLTRSRFAMKTGQAPGNPRAQFNEISPWIDGTLMYGPNKAWSDVLRSFHGGKLAENPDTPGYPPDNEIGLPIANPPVPYFHRMMSAKRFMVFGNPRTNENPMLLSMATLWFRTHNYHAERIQAAHPGWDDDAVFFEARKWTIAEHQHMVLEEWLPAWLGPEGAQDLQTNYPYTGYKPHVIPTISQEFQTAAMRYGHTVVTPGVYRRNSTCHFYNTSAALSNDPGKIALRTCNSFLRAREFLQETPDGWEAIMQGMSSQVAEREDAIITEDLRGFVFGPLEASRRDLMAINIQRGREHGMTDYNTVRAAFGLPRVTHFENITTNATVAAALKRIYGGDINKIDLWAGGIAETESSDANKSGPGPTFRAILIDQFTRVRDGDRFWYNNTDNGFFNATEIAQIQSLNITYMIQRVAKFPINMQDDGFHYNFSLPGCPQLKQLSQDDLEECTPPIAFDYFSTSGYDILWILLFAAGGWVFIAVIIFYYGFIIFAHKEVTEKDLVKQRTKTVRELKPPNDDPKTHSFGAVLYDGKKNEAVFLSHEEGALIVRSKGRVVLREIGFDRIMDLAWSDRILLVRIPSEFDLLVNLGEPSRTQKYVNVLRNDIETSEQRKVNVAQFGGGFEALFATARSHSDHTMRLNAFIGFALKKIIKSGLSVGDELPVENHEVKLFRDASQFTMSLDTFAEAFALPRTSLFLQHIFSLADRTNSGSISFQEFVDVMAVLCNGTPVQKMRLLFEMYDVDRRGVLTIEELRTMIRSTLEMTNLVDKDDGSIDKILASMIQSAGYSLSLDATYDFKAFQKIMGAQDGVAKQFGLKSSAITSRFGEDEPARVALGSQPKNAAIAESATYDAPKAAQDDDDDSTPLKALVRGYTSMAMTKRQTTRAGEKPLTGVVETPRKLTFMEKWHRWALERRLGIFWTWVLTIATLGTFAERAYTYSFEREHGGLRSIAGYGVTVTRGAASSIMFRSSVLLLPMCRNSITWLRGTIVNRVLPLDAAIGFHKANAFGALLFIIMHICGHMFNFYCISTQPPQDVACLFQEVYWTSDFLPSFHWWVFNTVTGISGILLVWSTIIVFFFALPFARRTNFNLFWYSHNTYPLYYFLMVLHGAAQLVQRPIFWLYFLGPACLFTVDKLASYAVLSRDIQVVKATILPAGVLELQFHKPPSFKYTSGQWVRIRCNKVSAFENHPFTITSSPHERHLAVFIRACGPWTSKIYEVYKNAIEEGDELPSINVEGAFGDAYQKWAEYHVSVMVGGGIGVTPFVSIIKDYLHQVKTVETLVVKKMYFLWVCRTQKQFEWVIDVLRALEEDDVQGRLEIHVFITELHEAFDLRTSLLYICERQFHKINGCSLFTGLQAPTHFGRPKFESIIRQIMFRHTEEQVVAVFACGSPIMCSGVAAAVEAIRGAPRPEDPVLAYKALSF